MTVAPPLSHCPFCGKPHRLTFHRCAGCGGEVPSCAAKLEDVSTMTLVHRRPCWRKNGAMVSCGPVEAS